MKTLTTPPVPATESSLAYPGWKIVLAGFFGVMVSFAAVVPYTFGLFLKPLARHLRLASRSVVRRIQHRRIDSSGSLAIAWLPARSLWATTHHPSLHPGFLISVCIPRLAYATPAALLPCVLHHRPRREWHGIPWLLTCHCHLVRSPPRAGALHHARWWRMRRHDSAYRRAGHHHSLRLAISVRFTGCHCMRLWAFRWLRSLCGNVRLRSSPAQFSCDRRLGKARLCAAGSSGSLPRRCASTPSA